MLDEHTSDEDNVLSKKPLPEEKQQEDTLRPRSFGDYIGQEDTKKNLRIFIDAAKKRGDILEHVLLYGPPGIGKTTLATIIAYELDVNIKTTCGPAIEKTGDLAAILSNLGDGDVLFIDEIHRLKPVIEEVLYSAMEDFILDIVIGKGPSARTMRINLPKFTLIGATTKAAMLSSPLRDRFGSVIKLDFYTTEDIERIIKRSSRILNIKVSDGASVALAKCCRKTPRIANRLLKRARDFASVDDREIICDEIAMITLKSLGIDNLGLDKTDRFLLKTIFEKFSGGPVGLNTLAAAIIEDEATIEEVFEPYLIQLGFLERTPRGRKITMQGIEHIGHSSKIQLL